MDFDREKVDDMVLALLSLTMHDSQGVVRAWKDFDWDTMDRLYAKGYISDPKSKARSVQLTAQGVSRSEELFDRFFRTGK